MKQGNGESAVPDPSLAGDDLDELVVTVARGEHGAYDALFRQLSGLVYRAALAVTRDRAQAEEIAQDVLLEIWHDQPFRPWQGQRNGLGVDDRSVCRNIVTAEVRSSPATSR